MIGKLHLLVALAVFPCRAASMTDFYFIDTGLGNATLIVASSGESLLLDAGLPETAAKIVEVAEKAGIVRINNLISTHYHHDHMGGVEPLSEKMPIDRFIDHGPGFEYKRSEDWWRELKGRQYREDMGKQYDEMYAGYLKAIAKGSTSL